MSRGKAQPIDLVKLWVIEIVVIAGAIYAGSQQSYAALCGKSSATPTQALQNCFTGSLSHMLFPWLVGASILIGLFAAIGTVALAMRSR